MPCVDENLAVCFLAGELTHRAAAEVEHHIDTCPACLVRLTAFARTQASSTSVAPEPGALSSAAGDERPVRTVLRRGATVGRYVVLDLVGAGAMGTVYSAADPVLRRTVALKLVRVRAEEDLQKPTDRLVREARLLAQVAHPNVVVIHDVGTYESQVFLAMDFVEGQTLRDWLAAPRTVPELLRVFVQAGRGLVAAHAAGVVHRDFKPENVLVGNDGRVVVTDFGLAREDSSPTEAGERLVGTPAYMAPEQLAGGVADHTADQYAFCVSLHEALCGERPAALERRQRAPLRTGSVPRRIRRAVSRGLAPSPGARHASMERLLAALVRDPWRPWRRYGVVAIAALVVFVIVAARGRQTQREISSCRATRSELGGVWDGPRKAAIEAAFRATKKPYAGDAWRSVVSALDPYTDEWSTRAADACIATRVRHDQSQTMLAAQTGCFRERFEEVRAVVDLLATADDDIVKNAAMLAKLPGQLDQCSSERARDAVAPPSAAIAPEVARLRGAIARGRALRDVGKMKEGLETVERAAEQSKTLGYPPLEAVALVELGFVQSRMGDKAKADETMARATRVADVAHDDGARVRALSHRLFLHGNVFKRADRVADLEAEASSALSRLAGTDPRAEEAYRYNLGMAYRGLGDLDRALVEMKRAIALEELVYGARSYETARGWSGLCVVLGPRDLTAAIPNCERAATIFGEALGPNHPDVALAVQNLGAMLVSLDKLDEGCANIERGYRIGASALGPDHLQVVAAESNLGECMSEHGDYARAVTLLEHALPARERIHGKSHIDVAHPLTRLGVAYLGAKAPERALPLLLRAREIREAGGATPTDRAETRFALARALWDTGDRAKARVAAKEALALFAEDPPSMGKATRKRKEAEAWVGQHP